MKSLVAYYSRTNVTKKLAESIASKTNADIEQIKPKSDYQGKRGFIRGGKDAVSAKIIELETLQYDPSEYDMVYLGAPVWAGKVANPLISYINQNEGKFDNVKFFITAGGTGFDGAIKQLEEATTKPQDTLSLTTKEVKKDLYEEKLSSFIE